MTKKYLVIGMAAILGASLSFFACESATGAAGAAGRLGPGFVSGTASIAGIQRQIDLYDGTGSELTLDNVTLSDTGTIDFKSTSVYIAGAFTTVSGGTIINAAKATVMFAAGAKIAGQSGDVIIGSTTAFPSANVTDALVAAPVTALPEELPVGGVTAVENLTLGAADDVIAGLTVYVYGKLTVNASSQAPTETDAQVVAVGTVDIAATPTETTALSDPDTVDVSKAALITTSATTGAVAVTLDATSPLSGPGISVPAAGVTLTVTGPTDITADITGAGTVTFASAVTAAKITGSGNVAFTNGTTATGFTTSSSSIQAATITFTNGFSTVQASPVTLDGNVVIPDTKKITLGHAEGTVTLAQGTAIKAGADTVLTATAETVLTGTATAALTATAAVTGEVPAPAKIGLGTEALTLTSGTLTVAADAQFDLGKQLTVAAGATLANSGTVTLTDTDGILVLTGATTTGGAKLTGAGAVTSGPTSIVGGASGWQAVQASGSANITITGGANGATIAGGENVALTALGEGAAITQKAGASNNLAISANTVIDLKGTASAAAGSIVLVKQTASEDVAKITLAADSVKILAGTGLATGTVPVTNLRTGLAAGGATGATAGNSVTAKGSVASAAGKLTQIIGAADNNTVTGPTSDATANCVISSVIDVTATG